MKTPLPYPRLLIGGPGGDSGKTLVSLALVRALSRAGSSVRAFKKGPDYIDAAWLGWACHDEARNLDTFLMGEEGCVQSFVRYALPTGFNVIEGNRGLHDGLDAQGTHSSASLARLLGAPVLLVLPVRKVTATAAAIVAGMAALDREVRLAGVVLNQVASPRHEHVARDAIEARTGIPVVGAIPALNDPSLLPARHLGLLPLHETVDLTRLEARLDEVARYLDLGAIQAMAKAAPPLPLEASGQTEYACLAPRVRIGVFRDAAFSFYYPDNLEALAAAGADLVFLSPLRDQCLPDLDALVLGGGFPETHADRLAENQGMRDAVRIAAESGLPIYAECGGLMYLARTLTWKGHTWPMSAALSVDVEVRSSPQGHGYAEVLVEQPNPFYPVGCQLRGHEFHYSTVASHDPDVHLAFALKRGRGALDGRDGIVRNNVLATYVHVHAVGTPEWADGILRAARAFHSKALFRSA